MRRSVGARLHELVVVFFAFAFVGALVSVPVALEQAVAHTRFDDRLGTLPVEVGLARNGVSTVDTGVLGKLYWDRTGVAGLGASVRVTGPPLAGGTLASYVTPAFARANARFLQEPDEVARAYGEELRSRVLTRAAWYALTGGAVVGTVLTVVARGRAPLRGRGLTRWRMLLLGVGATAAGLAASTACAAWLLSAWSGSVTVDRTYPMPDVPGLSFSSPQALEIARQVQPFVVKNIERIELRNDRFAEETRSSLALRLSLGGSALRAREGELVVLAEADPQGSRIGTRVRRDLYAALVGVLGQDTVALRTIAGDVTSNGTVAEEGFVEDEAAASPGIPVVAAKGDHDTATTVEQLELAGVVVPHLETVEVGGLRVASVEDPSFKALFGGLVVNESGTTPREAGTALREEVDEGDPLLVVLHQPETAAGYLGVDSLAVLEADDGSLVTPYDDGIQDVPPGSVTIGHLHDADGPWVLWNTDGDTVSWTVVTQLGTSGGVEESPTFNRFSTPFSAPLKAMSIQLHYLDEDSGLQTGWATIDIAPDATVTIGARRDVGLPGGQPVPVSELAGSTGVNPGGVAPVAPPPGQPSTPSS